MSKYTYKKNEQLSILANIAIYNITLTLKRYLDTAARDKHTQRKFLQTYDRCKTHSSSHTWYRGTFMFG